MDKPQFQNAHSKEKKMEKVKIECRRLILSWIENSSSHGLQNSARATSKFIKFLWLKLFLLLLITCVWCVYGTCLDYRQYRTTVSIAYVTESPTLFPAVTFCNLNPFNQTVIKQQMSKTVFFNAELRSCLDSYDIRRSHQDRCLNGTIVYKINNIAKVLKRQILNANLSHEDRVNYGFKLEYGMLVDCEFNGMPCHASEFRPFWHNDYGNCFTFNSGQNKAILKTNKVGSNHGLKLELQVAPMNCKSCFD
jgi:hypothetical protein